MKAILTHDGSIKIILSTDDRDSKIKANILSKERTAGSPTTPKQTTTIDLKQPILLPDDDDDDQFLEYKQVYKQVYLSTVCHVR